MTDTNTQTETTPAKPTPAPKPPRQRSSTGGWWALLLVLVLVGGSATAGYVYLWPAYQQQQQLHQRQLVDMQNQIEELRDINARQADQVRMVIQGEVSGIARQAYEREQQQQALLERYQRAVESVQAELANLDLSQQTTWRILEARNLVERAGQKLWIDSDVAATIQLLQLADSHLAALNNPAHRAARQALADDLFALQALPANQIDAAAMRLASVQAQLARVNWYQRQPGRSELSAVDDSADWWQQLQQSAGKLADQLVRVQYRETPVQPLLSDAFVNLLQQRTLLQLQIAQQAALAGRQDVYQQALQQALTMLQQLGATDVVEIQRAQSELDTLAQLTLVPEYPAELQATAQLERLARQATAENGQ
ncbi:uroporphyrinogen-III C-methyltransferase [Pseudidiomarina mangrovi]|uniref:uroporphyrinogen-III C-methyltransferase n=1 Tax=Pseudidiomarina mangrovi TaxID=2487133 RepID=UPI000FC99629|nr:uroporphyrinogen-III C-methyltransferase [Pseudidiomarina mangrovi]